MVIDYHDDGDRLEIWNLDWNQEEDYNKIGDSKWDGGLNGYWL